MKKSTLSIYALLLGFALHVNAQGSFYDVNTIQTIKISFEQDNWRYILDSLRFNGEGMLLGNVEINGKSLQDAGVRYRESRSFQPGKLRNSLYIKLNFIDKERNYEGHKAIKLSSALRDPSMVREVLGYEIARQYMPAPKANYSKVYVNNEYYGLFVNVEVIDDAFLKDNFGNSNGTFVRCEPNLAEAAPSGCKSDVYGSLQYDNGAKCYLHNFQLLSESGWDDLIELTYTLDQNIAEIERVLDVDRTLWMLAYNNVLVNLSSYSGRYSQNYYLYRDQFGRFTPIIYDLNLCFGSYKNTGTGSDLKLNELQAMDPLLHVDSPGKPLISKLLGNEEYKNIYLAHLKSIVNDFFRREQYVARVKELQTLIRPALEEDPNRYYEMKDFDGSLAATIGTRSRIPGIQELMNARTAFLKEHPLLTVLAPEIGDVKVLGREQFSTEKVSDFKIQAKVDKYPKGVFVYYRFSESEAFKKVKMLDDGASGDEQANDGIFGVAVKTSNSAAKIEYYIYAEGSKSASFDPPLYMHERHTASLEALNN